MLMAGCILIPQVYMELCGRYHGYVKQNALSITASSIYTDGTKIWRAGAEIEGNIDGNSPSERNVRLANEACDREGALI